MNKNDKQTETDIYMDIYKNINSNCGNGIHVAQDEL